MTQSWPPEYTNSTLSESLVAQSESIIKRIVVAIRGPMRWFKSQKLDQAASGAKKVSMYILSTCPSCNKARKFFADRNIPFQVVNYDLADAATQDRIMRELEAEQVEAFPFVRIGDQTVQGYDPKRYARLLGISPEAIPPGSKRGDWRTRVLRALRLASRSSY
jgi:glutaredoxin